MVAAQSSVSDQAPSCVFRDVRASQVAFMTSPDSPGPSAGQSEGCAAQVVVVSSVMFTFISYWRTAAVVLCDMSSTVYYIGGIVERRSARPRRGSSWPCCCSATPCARSTSKAARCSSAAASIASSRKRWADSSPSSAVSALLFDYVLTGPISGVSAGQYIIGLCSKRLGELCGIEIDDSTRDAHQELGLRRDRLRRHAVLLAPKFARHPRIERQSAEDHDRHHRHGRRHARLERRHARRSAARKSDAIVAARSEQEIGRLSRISTVP